MNTEEKIISLKFLRGTPLMINANALSHHV